MSTLNLTSLVLNNSPQKNVLSRFLFYIFSSPGVHHDFQLPQLAGFVVSQLRTPPAAARATPACGRLGAARGAQKQRLAKGVTRVFVENWF